MDMGMETNTTPNTLGVIDCGHCGRTTYWCHCDTHPVPMRSNHWDARDDEANHRAEHAQGKR